jgi:hypothetical protein
MGVPCPSHPVRLGTEELPAEPRSRGRYSATSIPLVACRFHFRHESKICQPLPRLSFRVSTASHDSPKDSALVIVTTTLQTVLALPIRSGLDCRIRRSRIAVFLLTKRI